MGNVTSRPKRLTAKEIRANFQRNQPERYWREKILAAISVLILILIIVSFVLSDSNNTKPAIVRSTKPQQPKTAQPVPPPQPVQTSYPPITGSDLSELRSNILLESQNVLGGQNLTPINVQLDLKNNILTYQTINTPSRFYKLTLLWGPMSLGGCESCDNAMQKNPGSEVLLEKKYNGFEYKVIALAK